MASSSFVLALTALVACSSSNRSGFADGAPGGGGGAGGGEETGGGSPPPGGGFGGPTTDKPLDETRDPVDCKEAEELKSYVGCDYWPTVTPNPVWSIFDYAVVVANTGEHDAEVQVTGPSGTNKHAVVSAGELKKIYLPWVRELKGADFNECTAGQPGGGSPPSSWRCVSPHELEPGHRLPVQRARIQRRGRRGARWQPEGLVEVPRHHDRVQSRHWQAGGEVGVLLVLERRLAAPSEHGDDEHLSRHGSQRSVGARRLEDRSRPDGDDGHGHAAGDDGHGASLLLRERRRVA